MNNTEQIEAWLNGELSEPERLAFEKRIAEDPALAEEVDLVRDIIKGITFAGRRAAIRQIEAGLEAENFFKAPAPAQKERRVIPLRNWLLMAAGFALVIAAAIWIFNPSQSTSPVIVEEDKPRQIDSAETRLDTGKQELAVKPEEGKGASPKPGESKPPQVGGQKIKEAYAAFYETEKTALPGILEPLEELGLADPDRRRKQQLAAALKHYEEGRFREARAALAAHLERYPGEQLAQLYLGLALLETGGHSEVPEYLAPLTEDASFQYAHTAKWYLALAYSWLGDSAKAIRLVKELAADSAHPELAARARSYLEQIEK